MSCEALDDTIKLSSTTSPQKTPTENAIWLMSCMKDRAGKVRSPKMSQDKVESASTDSLQGKLLKWSVR